MPDFIVAIPARYAASRLPGKPLRLLGGEPLVRHVARRALEAGAREVFVAADDARIIAAVADLPGVQAVLTGSGHLSGTDRLAECAELAGWAEDAIIVNLQGDEPFAPPEGIRAVAALLAESRAPMATLATPVSDPASVFDPNTVKVVMSHDNRALYFSRAPIPWHREAFADGRTHAPDTPNVWLRHIGIYAYRAGFLRQFAAMPPGQLEQIESLEQLRVLEAGHTIAIALTPANFPPGVDTPEDLARAEVHWHKMRAD